MSGVRHASAAKQSRWGEDEIASSPITPRKDRNPPVFKHLLTASAAVALARRVRGLG